MLAAELRWLRRHANEPLLDLVPRIIDTTGIDVELASSVSPAAQARRDNLDLFVKDSSYAKQWKYTNAPDADARAVQAAYWALQWATKQGKQSQISASVAWAVSPIITSKRQSLQQRTASPR